MTGNSVETASGRSQCADTRTLRNIQNTTTHEVAGSRTESGWNPLLRLTDTHYQAYHPDA